MTVVFMSYDIFNGEFLYHDTKKEALDYIHNAYPEKIRYRRYVEQQLQMVTPNNIYLIFFKISKVNKSNYAKQEAIMDAFCDTVLIN